MMTPSYNLAELIALGVLVRTDIDQYIVNYVQLQKYDPELIEHFALADLNDFEKEAYQQGYVNYQILPSGRLIWKRTQKKFKWE